MRRIGVLMAGDENDSEEKHRVSAFTQALAGLRWTDGRNMGLDLRWYGADINRMQALAQELVGLQPDIILTGSGAATVAVQRETRTIPIVFASANDPVAIGLVQRLDRPGGNVTGFGSLEASLGGKWLELLSEIAPGLKRAAIMFNPDTVTASAYMPSLETAVRSLKIVPIILPVHSDVEIETAIAALWAGAGWRPCRPAGWIHGHASRADHIGGGPEQRTGGLLAICLCQRRRLALLRTRPDRHLSPRRLVCRSYSARRKAGRSPGAASDEIRDGREPQDRHGARPCHTPVDPAAR
jgi:hypothetical protein